MASTKNKEPSGVEQYLLPHIETNTAATDKVTVPCKRRALFLSVETDLMHDKSSNELCFNALSPEDKATLQLLLYLTYCCKGELFQVTLENPDFTSMTPPLREDFAHGRLFCFVLNMDSEQCEDDGISQQDGPNAHSRTQDTISGDQLVDLLDMDVDMDVFRRDRSQEEEEEEEEEENSCSDDIIDEAFKAFMRLQLVRKKVSSLNNAMIAMRDCKGELSPAFDCIDIHHDTLNSTKVDRKTVRDLQGSLYTPAGQSGRQAVVLPETINELNLTALEKCIGTLTDSARQGSGKNLFCSLISKLVHSQLMEQKVIRVNYNQNVPDDVRFVRKLKEFTRELSRSTGHSDIDIRGLLVFRYPLAKLIDRETPSMFTHFLIHKHVPVARRYMEAVLREVRSRRRTLSLATLLNSGDCYCHSRVSTNKACGGQCQTAYACFYNSTGKHPFLVSRDDHSYYFAHLYPHLGKLERLSKELKQEHRGHKQFEIVADMVFNILVRNRFDKQGSVYQGLCDVVDEAMSNSSLSLGYHLPEIHQHLCEDTEHGCAPIKVYDQALVRYLFSDTFQVGRLFQASTTFNYIITNTAPRYTIERIMLLNITGPGEGKSYANNVLNCQFHRVSGCIETLTSFTPQAFKYKQNRNACVVMIDDAHITHEKNTRGVDRESNVIPNTFKNLLDTSMLESDVVTKDTTNGKVDTVKYQAVHNCGFVWNTNTMGFISDAWADRCLIMESEFPEQISRTRSSKQIRDTVESCKMDRIAQICLYRQNLIQSATMISDSEIMQFGARFDKARDTCLAALYASHIVCTGMVGRRVSFCINQLVFAEAMKLACHFIFDLWIPPWTRIPDPASYPDLTAYIQELNKNRLRALNKLSFGQMCLETNAVYKLCTAACLPDICPRAVDMQGRFACKVLGHILTQIHGQNLKTAVKDGALCISGIDGMCFSEEEIKGGSETAHEMLMLCSTCRVPARASKEAQARNYKLCTYKLATRHVTQHVRRGQSSLPKKVSSVTLSQEAVYDLLALYAPISHSGFWTQLITAMVEAYENGEIQDVNALGQCHRDIHEQDAQLRRLSFTLDFSADPVRSLILESTSAIKPLNELNFNRCTFGSETFQCSAPLHYGGVLLKELGDNAPQDAHSECHIRESRIGPRNTFHGPRLSVYSTDYSGVPVKHMSSFCTTRTIYHQDQVILRNNRGKHSQLFTLEKDWEWKDAADVFNHVRGDDVFTVAMLKRDYAVTMTKMGEYYRDSVVHGLPWKEGESRTALSLRKGVVLGHDPSGSAEGRPLGNQPHHGHHTNRKAHKRSAGEAEISAQENPPPQKKKTKQKKSK